jgi:hypothetical protein
MTPDAEREFIRLWNEGASYADIAAAMGVKAGTGGSRAHLLVRQGKIAARPRGGSYPKQKALARQDGRGVSADTPGVSTRVSIDTPPVQVLPPSQDDMRPLLTDILTELRQLTGALAARVSAGASARTPLPAERGKSVRWNLHLSERVRERVKTMAEARGLQDSQMVEELLWLALAALKEA